MSRRADEYELDPDMMDPFDRVVASYLRLSTILRGVKPRSRPVIRPSSSVDLVMNALRNSYNWDTGLSSSDIAEKIGKSKSYVQKALRILVRRGTVKHERRGKYVRYYLARGEESQR
ncbi:MAG: hypothetical protein DRO43_05880 [Candidatus Hecatellales archaeon]|mgnify:CR=1 FL=1|nr:MAG: hypothetical protein DRO43_05880 [Candidatus Hecatellales archaeon]